MKRISRERLRTDIWIALTVLRPDQKRAVGAAVERAREQVVDELVDRIMGPPASEAVILVPSLCGPVLSPRRGRWGEDEPYPHPDLPTE